MSSARVVALIASAVGHLSLLRPVSDRKLPNLHLHKYILLLLVSSGAAVLPFPPSADRGDRCTH